MNSIEKIEQLFSQLSATNNNLSLILPQLYPIALECKDYIGFYTLFLWGVTISINRNDLMICQCKEAGKLLKDSGVNEREIIDIAKEAMQEYLTLRGFDDPKKAISLLPVKDMEEVLKLCDNAQTKIENFLNDDDNQMTLEERKKLCSKRDETLKKKVLLQKQYNDLHNFILSKLAKYKNIMSHNIDQDKKRFPNTKKIFIIHGHHEAKRRELESLLKDKFNLTPIVLSEQPNIGLTIIEKFEKYASECSYAFAIFTPDDIVTKSEDEQYFQARPNVIFELGWFYATLGRSRVCIVEQESN